MQLWFQNFTFVKKFSDWPFITPKNWYFSVWAVSWPGEKNRVTGENHRSKLLPISLKSGKAF
jgi:hypothetical protein